MLIYVLLYNVGKEEEGIHSIDVKGKTIVLMFEDFDDAERYCGLLEAQDFPTPTVEVIDKEQIDNFCSEAGYQTRLIQKGFLPQTADERIFISPPQRNLDVETWKKDKGDNDVGLKNEELETMRKRLENLL